jgi:hypothetical protein
MSGNNNTTKLIVYDATSCLGNASKLKIANTMQRLFLIASFLFLFFNAQSQQIITGEVIDLENGELLPFATIAFKNSTLGTVTNSQGSFTLQVPELLVSDSLVISYIGYEDAFVPLTKISSPIIIELTPAILQLADLVILPLSPEDYLKRAVKKFPLNYANQPFTTKSYYRELLAENNEYLSLNEAVFKSSYPDYQDTIKNQHQLVLYRNTQDKERIDFMRSFADKQNNKQKKKAEKKEEEWNEDDSRDLVQANFGGPETILSLDLINGEEVCLDSTRFKKFRYSFGPSMSYQGRALMVINFESKGQVDNQRQKGVIYLDLASDAITGLEYSSELVIPIALQPILFAFGLSVKDPFFVKKVRYQFQEGRWYPDTFQWELASGLKKRHIFKANEYSDFDIKQIFKVNELVLNDPTTIPEDQQFDPEEEMETQVHNKAGLDWNDVNTLPIEALK